MPPLIDALDKNGSLRYLDLSGSGVEWDGAHASGASLLQRMATNASTLGGLQTIVIDPVRRLRPPPATVVVGGG